MACSLLKTLSSAIDWSGTYQGELTRFTIDGNRIRQRTLIIEKISDYSYKITQPDGDLLLAVSYKSCDNCYFLNATDITEPESVLLVGVTYIGNKVNSFQYESQELGPDIENPTDIRFGTFTRIF